MLKSYKDIERAREVRLWVRDIIVPVAGVVTAAIALYPEKVRALVDKIKKHKNQNHD